MTVCQVQESRLERILSLVMLAAFWAAFVTLAVGLTFWLAHPHADTGSELLNAGLLGLLALPLLRLVAAIASGLRDRDWLTVGATLAVLAILFALTIRDAVRMPQTTSNLQLPTPKALGPGELGESRSLQLVLASSTQIARGSRFGSWKLEVGN